VKVETSDHARLALQLSYNWNFQVDKSNSEDAHKLFSVPDFVGDSCKAIASRVRGCVAACTFDDFHRNSARIIRSAVFGLDENQKVCSTLQFPSNNLSITNIDIQSVEPVDHRTRDSLQKSVQLAIEITTNSQEANARHEAMRIEQAAKGKLDRQKLTDDAKSEEVRRELTRLQALSATVEITGQTTAEAKARTEAAEIESRAAVTQARLKAEAQKIEAEEELRALEARRKNEIEHRKQIDKLEIDKANKLSEIESQKFASVVEAIGTSTLKSIAQAGPELQAKLLSGLGLKSFMITDGNSPINLFNTANGLIGGKMGSSSGGDSFQF
jgi:major vault protein